jgi:NAD+ synthase
VEKNRFPGVVLGLSGGIDSAVVATMAVDALGKERVHCVMLPYAYTSKDSLVDAEACAKLLGVRYDVVPIKEPVEGFLSALKPMFAGKNRDITEENIQSRARGTVLMAISNKFGSMVLTTGNKSEMSVGYATLYGDMNGGFNPIKDVYKTDVYRLAKWRNAQSAVIPERILTKAPTAELRENQKDVDTLPPYDVLDDILSSLVENELPVAEIVKRGHAEALVKRVQHMLYVAEYKRRRRAGRQDHAALRPRRRYPYQRFQGWALNDRRRFAPSPTGSFIGNARTAIQLAVRQKNRRPSCCVTTAPIRRARPMMPAPSRRYGLARHQAGPGEYQSRRCPG